MAPAVTVLKTYYANDGNQENFHLLYSHIFSSICLMQHYKLT